MPMLARSKIRRRIIATANAIRYCDARPVVEDIEPATFNLNPSLIETAITDRTKAILHGADDAVSTLSRRNFADYRGRLFSGSGFESAPPARTHSSTSEILNFQRRPSRWAGKWRRSIQR